VSKHRRLTLGLLAPVLAIRQALLRSWTSWSLTRALRQQKRAERRLILLLQESDSQLLRQKELRQRVLTLQHRQLENRASQQYRQEGILSETIPSRTL